MGNLKWYDSPHWNRKDREPVIVEEPVATAEPEFPPLMSPRTTREIEDAIRDDPRYNAINPSNQAHIISLAITNARESGMLIEEQET